MRPVGLHSIPPECAAVVLRPRLCSLLVLTIMLISLFLTFHVLYDSAVYSMQAVSTLPVVHHNGIDINMNSLDDESTDNRYIAAHPSTSSSTASLLWRKRQRLQSATVNDDDRPFETHSMRRIASAAVALPAALPHPLINPYRFPKTCRRLPQALIVGVRKAGTRALLEMLYLHPRVQKAAGEVHFFDRDENYNLGLEWYRKKMPFSFRGQITIEKSPSYFVMPEVPERVRAMNATIKILIIVRDPVTRAISDYTQLRSHAATAAMPQPSATVSKSFEELVMLPNGTVNESYRPLVVSLYHLHIQRWLEVFPREQILIVNGDRLIEDPVSQLQQIEKFLGLEHRIGRHNFYFNETKGFYCLRTDTADKCLRETKGRKHPHVDPVVLTRLRRYFAEHNQRFYEMIGDDLGWPEN